MEFFRCDDPKSMFLPELHVLGPIQLSAQPYLKDKWFCEQAFLNSAAYGRSMGILRSPVLVPGVVVRVQLDKSDRAVLGVDGPQNRQQDGVIASNTEGNGIGI